MTSTPCISDPALYDRVLFDDATSEERAQARSEAAALCARCPSPCDARVTDATQPQPLVLLPAAPRRRPRVPKTGRDYVRPQQRPAAWARMARALADEGRSLPDIAAGLCVSEATAQALLDRTSDERRAA